MLFFHEEVFMQSYSYEILSNAHNLELNIANVGTCVPFHYVLIQNYIIVIKGRKLRMWVTKNLNIAL